MPNQHPFTRKQAKIIKLVRIGDYYSLMLARDVLNDLIKDFNNPPVYAAFTLPSFPR